MNSFWSSSTTSFKCFPFQSIFMHTKAYLQAWISQIKIQHLFDACVNSHTAIQFEQGQLWWVHKQQRDMLKHQQASYSNSRKFSTHHSLAQLLNINKLLHLFVSFQFTKRHKKRLNIGLDCFIAFIRTDIWSKLMHFANTHTTIQHIWKS